MSNKLRDMLNDSNNNYAVRVNFDTSEKYNDFLEAINRIAEDGTPASVDGISSIRLAHIDGDSEYPIEMHNRVERITVLPNEDCADIDVSTDNGIRKVTLARIICNKKTILRSRNLKGISIELTNDIEKNKFFINYDIDYSKADNLTELIDSYNTVYYLLRSFFKSDIKDEKVENFLNYFLLAMEFFERLDRISDYLAISIVPSQLKDIENKDCYVEKLYFSIIEKKVIRSNRRVNYMNNVRFPDGVNPGKNQMAVTYVEKESVSLNGSIKEIYSVNVAFNLIIDREEQKEDGNCKLYFKEDENNPMFISSRYFINEEEMEKEFNNSLDSKETYLNAFTLAELLKENHERFMEAKKSPHEHL